MKARLRRRGTLSSPTDKRPSWLARLSFGTDPETRERRRLNKTFPTRREAEEWLTAEQAKADGGQAPPAGKAHRFTLAEWLTEWADLWSDHLAPRTREEAIASLYRGLTPALLACPLRNLFPAMIQRRLKELLDAGQAPRTVHYFYRNLRARLAEAVERGRLVRNPMAERQVRPPKLQPRDGRVLTAAEAGAFLELCRAAPERFGVLWQFLLLTGLRPEEALALRWQDVEGGAVQVRRALVRRRGVKGLLEVRADGKRRRIGSGLVEFRPPKGGRSRSVPIPPALQRELQRHRAAQAKDRLLLGAEYRGQDLVFAGPFGGPLDWSGEVKRGLKPLLARLALHLVGESDKRQARAALGRTGLDRFRAYDLRHTAATLMLAGRERTKAVADILGHADPALTLRTYEHVSPGDLSDAVARLERTILEGRAAG